MANEVETILNEIRERLRLDQEQANASAALAVQGDSAKDAFALPYRESGPESSESLRRMSAHLTTTGRAWRRLPPLWSNRTGVAARLELWIKTRLKIMSRWFTWEQVNFNSAVHHALSESSHMLASNQQELAGLRNELRGSGVGGELTTRLAELAHELRESDQQLREEQRVCFKQLSLEAGEAAVAEDRGRRAIESRLSKLEEAVPRDKQ